MKKRLTMEALYRTGFLLLFLLCGISFLSLGADAASKPAPVLRDVRKAPAKNGTWVKKGKYWRYRCTNKQYAKSTWLKVNGKYYYFKANGNMAVGWLTYNKNRYYLKSSGEMATGWVLYKKKWYYLNSNGVMASNRLLTYRGKKYYLGRDGIMVTGWNTVSKKKYYFSKDGSSANGWTKVRNTWYYLNKDGILSPYKKASQILFVKASGNRAVLTMIEKKTSTAWKEILNTSGYVGRLGVGKKSGEGIPMTPQGTFTFGRAFGNNSDPGSTYPYTKVNSSHYWVDDPSSIYYNKFVSSNDVSVDWNSAEHLSDSPRAYAYAISINYNTDCIPGAGSAIFLHCDGGGPTAGCIAVPESDMIYILRHLRQDAVINISNN